MVPDSAKTKPSCLHTQTSLFIAHSLNCCCCCESTFELPSDLDPILKPACCCCNIESRTPEIEPETFWLVTLAAPLLPVMLVALKFAEDLFARATWSLSSYSRRLLNWGALLIQIRATFSATPSTVAFWLNAATAVPLSGQLFSPKFAIIIKPDFHHQNQWRRSYHISDQFCPSKFPLNLESSLNPLKSIWHHSY